MTDSLKNLQDLISVLELPMKELGFTFVYEGNSISSGGPFATGFFSDDKLKIGLIFRGNEFGQVIYETSYSNISHDMIMEFLGKSKEQKLFDYMGKSIDFERNINCNGFNKIGEAFLNDFSNTIWPYISKTDIVDINKMIKKERKKIGL
jgi:hypothetical protein